MTSRLFVFPSTFRLRGFPGKPIAMRHNHGMAKPMRLEATYVQSSGVFVIVSRKYAFVFSFTSESHGMKTKNGSPTLSESTVQSACYPHPLISLP